MLCWAHVFEMQQHPCSRKYVMQGSVKSVVIGPSMQCMPSRHDACTVLVVATMAVNSHRCVNCFVRLQVLCSGSACTAWHAVALDFALAQAYHMK
jgi:hypothetical protein